MKIRRQAPFAALTVAFALSLLPPGAMAEKGGKHGNSKEVEKEKGREKGKESSSQPKHDDGGNAVYIEFRFGDGDREMAREYYQNRAPGQKCPPGLAKKGNGCMPPGQAKKWARGRPLSKDVVVHDLPSDLRYRLPAPPSGHRYVQVGADILMIAIGTSMVVDAIEDIVR